MQSILYNLCDSLFLYFYWTKTIERERKRERIIKHVSILSKKINKTCEHERDGCSKVLKKWLYKYHFSFFKYSDILVISFVDFFCQVGHGLSESQHSYAHAVTLV